MMAMRNRPQGDKTFAGFLEELKTNVLAALENQDYPFPSLVGRLGIQRETGRNPLFNVVFNMVNVEFNEIRNEDFTISHYDTVFNETVFDLILTAFEGDDRVNLKLQYATALYNRTKGEKMAKHYIDILEQVLENPDIRLEDIKISHSLIAAKTSSREQTADIFGF